MLDWPVGISRHLKEPREWMEVAQAGGGGGGVRDREKTRSSSGVWWTGAGRKLKQYKRQPPSGLLLVLLRAMPFDMPTLVAGLISGLT
jgi:hypothetical protein